MVAVYTTLLHAEFGPNEQWEDAFRFRLGETAMYIHHSCLQLVSDSGQTTRIAVTERFKIIPLNDKHPIRSNRENISSATVPLKRAL